MLCLHFGPIPAPYPATGAPYTRHGIPMLAPIASGYPLRSYYGAIAGVGLHSDRRTRRWRFQPYQGCGRGLNPGVDSVHRGSDTRQGT